MIGKNNGITNVMVPRLFFFNDVFMFIGSEVPAFVLKLLPLLNFHRYINYYNFIAFWLVYEVYLGGVVILFLKT